MEIGKCKICGNEANFYHCEEHYVCEKCGKGREAHLCSYSTDGLLCKDCHQKLVDRRIAEFDKETDYTYHVVCPWCGYEHHDSWEMSDGEWDCPDCGNKFEMTRDVDVTYCTERIK